MYPCDSGNCASWVGFIDATVGALQASGLKIALHSTEINELRP